MSEVIEAGLGSFEYSFGASAACFLFREKLVAGERFRTLPCPEFASVTGSVANDLKIRRCNTPPIIISFSTARLFWLLS